VNNPKGSQPENVKGVSMKDYEYFQMEALVAKRGTVPAYDEIILEEPHKMVTKFTSWQTNIVQEVAKAANLPELKDDEEMIIVVRQKKDED
jgi:hypothetical protein